MTDLELDSLDQNVRDLGIKVEMENIRNKIHCIQCNRKIEGIQNALNLMNKDKIKEDMAYLALQASSQADIIQAIEDADLGTQISGLSDKVGTAKQSLYAMNQEHQAELEALKGSVTSQADYLDRVNDLLAGIIQHQVISEDMYQALGTQDNVSCPMIKIPVCRM